MSFSTFDHECMSEALRLARRGLNTSHPNPRVGCVLARDGHIVARAWHERAGGPHAEILALKQAGAEAKDSTAYVTLEPCSHHGRTPPCSDALVHAGVSRVVAAMHDPNPEVNGSGLERLQTAGILVESGLLGESAERLNAGFIKRMRSGRPWVRIKLAQSLDGRTALRNGDSQWISCTEAREDVQRWRARSSAILTGIGTVLADDPSLNVRSEPTQRQPLRVIADGHWRTPPMAKTLALPGSVLIAGRDDIGIPRKLAESAAECLPLPSRDGRLDLEALMGALGQQGINEIQVEAGQTLCGALLDTGLVDELLLYVSPDVLGEGSRGGFSVTSLKDMSDRIRFRWLETGRVGSNLCLRLQPQRRID